MSPVLFAAPPHDGKPSAKNWLRKAEYTGITVEHATDEAELNLVRSEFHFPL